MQYVIIYVLFRLAWYREAAALVCNEFVFLTKYNALFCC